jgi:F1F0 ATPase subunit 2
MTLDIASLLLSAASGAGAGLLFFGGLWLTVRALPSVRTPALMMLGSFVVRSAAAMGLIWLGARGDWRGALAAVFGFTLARLALTRRLRTARASMAGGE